MKLNKVVLSPMTHSECVQWVESLRSGNYTQGKHLLKYNNMNGGSSYCCLGVEQEVHPKQCELVTSASTLTHVTSANTLTHATFGDYVRIPSSTQLTLMRMNDEGQSFETIADWIEKHLVPRYLFADALRSIGWGV